MKTLFDHQLGMVLALKHMYQEFLYGLFKLQTIEYDFRKMKDSMQNLSLCFNLD